MFHVRRTGKIAPLTGWHFSRAIRFMGNLHIRFVYGSGRCLDYFLGRFFVAAATVPTPPASVAPDPRQSAYHFHHVGVSGCNFDNAYHFRLYMSDFESSDRRKLFNSSRSSPFVLSMLSRTGWSSGWRLQRSCPRLAESLVSLSNSLASDGNFSRV